MINCPKCKSEPRQIGSTAKPEGVLMRWECQKCKHRYTTVEKTYTAAGQQREENSDAAKAAMEIVAIELGKAKGKHPVFPADPAGGLAIITEEYLELVQAVNDKLSPVQQVMEAAQSAATFIRFIEKRLGQNE